MRCRRRNSPSASFPLFLNCLILLSFLSLFSETFVSAHSSFPSTRHRRHSARSITTVENTNGTTKGSRGKGSIEGSGRVTLYKGASDGIDTRNSSTIDGAERDKGRIEVNLIVEASNRTKTTTTRSSANSTRISKSTTKFESVKPTIPTSRSSTHSPSTRSISSKSTSKSSHLVSLSSTSSTSRTITLLPSTTIRISPSDSTTSQRSTRSNSTRLVSTSTHRTTSTSLASRRNSTTSRRHSTAIQSSSRTSHTLTTHSSRTTSSRDTPSHHTDSTSVKPSPTLSTTKARPSPTSYGSAPRKGCIQPPKTFEGSGKGFSNLCRVRYCDAKPRRNMIWSGFDGEVTREEIESALGMLANLEPVWQNGQGNILGDGALGQGAYSASLLFEITGDIRALDIAVRISDNILALQNQNTENPVTIWTGDVDPVWPTPELPPNNKHELIYAGCEQGEIVSNMVNSALMILKSPCLWKKIPPVFDGPTVFNDTATYYDRALAYIAAGDDTYENYFFRFFDSAGSIIQPADERWWATGDTRAPGTLMPWNRRMQIVHGALKLAAAHETPAAYNLTITKYYDSIVQRNVMDFLGALNKTRGKVEGIDIFQWDCSAMEEHTEEAKGIHALYDIFGSWLAWQRSSASYYLSNDFGKIMAQTFQHQINLGNGSFAGLVTGESTKKGHTIDSLWGHWSFYGFFLPEWFYTVARSNVDHGFQGRTWLAIPLLWTKHALHVNDLTFWTGQYSSGYGYVLGTNGKSISSSMIQWSEAARVSTFSTLLTSLLGLCASQINCRLPRPAVVRIQ
ncbi:hypothetical protein JCM5350_003641 [Sporobolomyces pararoseus]